ncbi:type VI secretion system-associated FHA domain protein TagH [Paracoccus tegillarcae]|uniref:Type VI secretion system-associated FHA domain protein TagH n=1 Tax=Paracoccus tegillarcae TaxID=1529068 RepID=A0A2K9EXY7_9RHOB|nr:type VI secretion system-associated FHA domain protein TagH [Paracoccus tegillarcae]AUH32952.1 type VI secretion system-associated FHA domain protein TagH [Paracoccus tegillarcae]
MTLTLQIENYQILDDGGPASVQIVDTGLSAGRSSGMGWVLPDASRHISGHHFDIFRDDKGWWLRDVSTNGTFLQGQRYRLDGPHKLNHGDRFQVGQYIIVVLVDQPAGAAALTPASLPDRSQAPGYAEDPWALGSGGHVEPVDPLPPSPTGRRYDFADDFISTGQGGVAPMPVPAMPPPAPLPNAPQPARSDVRETTGIKAPAPPVAEQDFVRAFCKGAGLAPDLYADIPPAELAQALGETVRRVSQQVMMSLQDRAAAKQFARTGERTMRGATDNNPLKFLPDVDQAIEAMYLKPRAGFQNGPDGFEDALTDLRLHQAALFAALQPALARLMTDLAPETIEPEAETGRLGGNKRAKAWEIFVERWDKKTAPHENGMLDEFLNHFSTAYREMAARQDGAGNKGGSDG